MREKSSATKTGLENRESMAMVNKTPAVGVRSSGVDEAGDDGGEHVAGTVSPQASRAQIPPEVLRSPKSAGHGAKPAAVRDRAVAALLTSLTIDAAAHEAGIDVRTLRRWLADEAFAARVTAARQVAFEDSIDRVRGLADRAVETIVELLTSAPASVRLAAARTLLELGVHRGDVEAIVERLDDLERRQRERHEARRWTA